MSCHMRAAHITSRFESLGGAASERVVPESTELARLCVWLEDTDRASEVWRCLYNDVKQVILKKATEADGWTALTELVQSLSDKSDWGKHFDDLASNCAACTGLVGNRACRELAGHGGEHLAVGRHDPRARPIGRGPLGLRSGHAAHVYMLGHALGVSPEPLEACEKVIVEQSDYVKADNVCSDSRSAASVEKSALVKHWESVETRVKACSMKRTRAADNKLMGLLKQSTDCIARPTARCAEVNWKAKLTDNAPGVDILREVAYFFWQGAGSNNALDEFGLLFEKGTQAWQAYDCAAKDLQLPVDTKTKGDREQTGKTAKVLCTEEYMVRQIEETGDAAERKLSRRLTRQKQRCLQQW